MKFKLTFILFSILYINANAQWINQNRYWIKTGNISQTGVSLSWNSNILKPKKIKYLPYNGAADSLVFADVQSQVSLMGLKPATVYSVGFYENATDNQPTAQGIYVTNSASSGKIEIYFNHKVDGTKSSGQYPKGFDGNLIVDEIINKINKANLTVDVCLYNNDRTTVRQALENAKSRGVRVRYVTGDENANQALSPTPSFPFIKVSSNDGLMHNKYIVIDADDPDNSWVVAGSMNLTSQNILQDYNNTIMIQDQSLARAYELEMNELWGSETGVANTSKSKSGNSKTDNTPHEFTIGDKKVELYFSPSDQTTSNLVNVLNTCEYEIQFALLTFTSDPLANALVNNKTKGASCRGIIESINDTGSEYDYLNQNGINTLAHTLSGQLHHKYAIIDGQHPSSDPTVISGSHNWSNSAETRNDENTLVIHDAIVANLFFQEFEGRWCELTVPNCYLAPIIPTNDLPNLTELSVYPNPVQDELHVQLNDYQNKNIGYYITDVTGRLVMGGSMSYDQHISFPVRTLPQGVYFLFLKNQKGEDFAFAKFAK